ncbi:CHRD domain protein [Rubripirellula tenax]|uniref:CHRD domain protein n=1 Tax=Rubripirellula tenax TaxID=2528015 RepID=A0A5C6FDP7_9BACT|nr:CHRD domain-containing protein [Rubripirellula tenax]TWU58797.1 CHRD domain protein [Rubripirellula tenax]
MRFAVLPALMLGLLSISTTATAATVNYDVVGVAGFGLLPGNERPNPAASPGSGGEIGATGIQFDDVAKTLLINVGWGSQQGFTDLSGPITAGHIHSAGTGGGINGAGGVLINIGSGGGILDNSASNGIVNFTTRAFTPAEETLLANGDLYLNFHSASFGGGEIRGNLVVSAVPEPGTLAAMSLIATAVFVRYRRKRNA